MTKGLFSAVHPRWASPRPDRHATGPRASHLPFLIPLALSTLALFALVSIARAQSNPGLAATTSVFSAQPLPKSKKSKASPSRQDVQPDLQIPAAPLGFAPPASYYLGLRIAQVTLTFLDEDRLLFTFRVPGLISREHTTSNLASGEEPGIDQEHNERHIRAVVLALPSGKIQSEALWRLHDLAPYLLPLKGDKFLLRDRNTVKVGDATLHLNLFLRFPGLINRLEISPDERLLVANTTEPPPAASSNTAPRVVDPAKTQEQPAPSAITAPVPSPNPVSSDLPEPQEQSLLRIMRMDNRSVLLYSHVAGARRVPIDGEGFYEALRGQGTSWLVSFQDFQGASIPLQSVDSLCSPTLDVMAPGVVLASACLAGGARQLTAITRDKRRLWQMPLPYSKVWPQLTTSQNGLRLARETLEVSHPVGPNYPLDYSDIRGQSIQVYDLATGNVQLTVAASPILDGGGNFALSPSGTRLAVLNDGAIQIYHLPAAAPLPQMSAMGSHQP